MQTFTSFVVYLLSNKKTLVYTTFKTEDYAKVIDQLKAADVKHRVVVFSGSSVENAGKPLRTYKIYVRKDDEHAALQAMYHS